LDLFLPESSGLQTLEKIKEAAPRIPIIVMSGIYTDWLAIHALRLGAFCVLKKDWLDGKNLARAFRYYADLVPAD
jgi:DNA-binding NarL/FixJ family response regulator